MEIKVLGTGCSKCKTLEKNSIEALSDLGITAEVIKEENIVKIMEYGVMSTPALVIDNKVVLSGKVASVKELKNIINQ